MNALRDPEKMNAPQGIVAEKQSFNIYKPQVQGVSLSTWGVVRRELCFQLPEFTRASQSRRDQW